ncbi:MAG: hypothetical protein JWM71_688 [Solirubrobacteraceae bacterium]|nr:hypothetical protein [Solirubrobacteraceae bacterium]
MNEFAQILEEAGGAAAPSPHFARLRTALAAELARGERELAQPRSGYAEPLTVVFATGLVATPAPSALRADPGAASERAWLLVAAAVGALVGGEGGEILAAGWERRLVLLSEGADPEYATLAFEDQSAGIDRLRARALQIPDGLIVPEDARPPINSAFIAAQTVAHLGARPADQEEVERLTGIEMDATNRPHDDPDPSLRAARRILQRLRGMGKWGGYHTEFAHLAKGFPGHERALALEVGEALLSAGLLAEKPSVGQRHVFLAPGRAAEIHRLTDDGVAPEGLVLP